MDLWLFSFFEGEDGRISEGSDKFMACVEIYMRVYPYCLGEAVLLSSPYTICSELGDISTSKKRTWIKWYINLWYYVS